MAEWVYLKPETWDKIKKEYVARTGGYKEAAERCNMSSNTFRKIGIWSNWVPKESFDTILEEIGTDYSALNGDIRFYTEEEKKEFAKMKEVKKKKERYGSSHYADMARVKHLDHEQIISEISRVFDFDENGLDIIRFSLKPENNGMEGFVCSVQEQKFLEILSSGATYGSLLKKCKNKKQLDKYICSLSSEGIIRIEAPYSKSYKEDKIRIIPRKDRIKEISTRKLEKVLEKIKKLENDTENGYFVCKKEGRYMPFQLIPKDYTCPSCSSGISWVVEKNIYLRRARYAVERALRKIK